MLNNSYTLGASPNNLVFAKRFDNENSSTFSVAGLSAAQARTFSTSHQKQSNGSWRRLIDLSEIDPDPLDTTGLRTMKNRVYIVVEQASSQTPANVKKTFARLKTLVDDTTFQDQFLNGEV